MREANILRNRAKEIAGRKSNVDNIAVDSVSVVEFILVPERYAIAGNYVSEVLPLTEITPIPGAPSYIMGVINLRGKIISLLNLKIRLSLKEKGLTDFNKVIILKNENMEFGIVVDSIVGTRSIPLGSLSTPPITLVGISADLVVGISTDGIILLNAERMLNSKELIVNQK